MVVVVVVVVVGVVTVGVVVVVGGRKGFPRKYWGAMSRLAIWSA